MSAIARSHLETPRARTVRLAFWPERNAPIVSPSPRTLLIDNDVRFTFALEKIAERYDVALRAVGSVLTLDQGLHWDFDLVLLDVETIGVDFVQDVALDLMGAYGHIPIVALVTDRETEKRCKKLGGVIAAVLSKGSGTEDLFMDAMKAFATHEEERPVALRAGALRRRR